MAKKSNEKTPFQQSKKTKIEEKKAEIVEEQEAKDTTRSGEPGPQKKARKKYTKKSSFVAPSLEESAVEAQFFLELTTKLRQGAGITKPMPEFYNTMFASSYHTMACKYGPIMSRFLPELMFGGTIFLIGIDTVVELRKIKVAEALAAKDAKEKEEKDTSLKGVVDLDSPTFEYHESKPV